MARMPKSNLLMKQNQNVLCSVVDMQGKFLLCNDVFSRYTGTSPQELIGKNITDVFSPGMQKIRQAIDACKARPLQTYSIEVKTKTNTGSNCLRWTIYAEQQNGMITGIHLSGRVVKEAGCRDASPYSVSRTAAADTASTGKNRNKTTESADSLSAKRECRKLERENKAIEQNLFQSRLLFEQFMQNSPLVAWVTDAGGTMQYMNPVHQKTYGFTAEHFGKNLYQLFSPQMAEEYAANNLRVLSTGAAVDTLESAIDANGTRQVLKVHKFPLLINGRQMVGGWAINITDQVEMQEKLLKSIERHEYVNEATSDAIYDWNFTTGKLYKSVRFEKLFGYPEKEVSIRHRLAHIHPADVDKFKKVVFQSLRSEAVDKWEVEYRLRLADGSFKTVSDKAFIIRNTQKVTRVIGALQDITAQKEMQQKLINQEKKSKREFIKSVIETQEKERRQLSVELHDNVNQILASCKLMLEVALENGQNAKLLTQKSYQGIQAVINEIRTISHHLNPSAIADVGLVEVIEQMMEKINLSGKLSVCFKPGAEEGLKMLQEQDNIAIFRIVQEQLNNILKHAAATHVLITLQVEDNTVKLMIKDDGVGFDVNKCKKGLGLRNIYNRVEYYSGTLDIESSIGNGCTMYITLNTKVKICASLCPE